MISHSYVPYEIITFNQNDVWISDVKLVDLLAVMQIMYWHLNRSAGPSGRAV